MKRLALSVLLFAAAAGLRGAEFEGRLHFQRAELDGDPHDVFCWIRGDKIRVEVWGGDRAKPFLTDLAKKEVTVVLEDDMAYVTLPVLEPLEEPPPLEGTGASAELHGHATEKFLVVSEEGTTELWLTRNLGPYPGFGDGYHKPPAHIPGVDVPPPPDPRPWEYSLAGTHLFPLRVITRDAYGRIVFRLEAKSITAQPPDDRLFRPPVNYRKVESWPK